MTREAILCGVKVHVRSIHGVYIKRQYVLDIVEVLSSYLQAVAEAEAEVN